MSCIIHNNILDINPIQVFYPYIKVSDKNIISNNILDINSFYIFILILKVNNIFLPNIIF
jgi:hypothetical protein